MGVFIKSNREGHQTDKYTNPRKETRQKQQPPSQTYYTPRVPKALLLDLHDIPAKATCEKAKWEASINLSS